MLEVCVDSFESTVAAINGGAGRIELCSALSEGGLTPSQGLLEAVKTRFPDTKVFAMLRPHGRNSFEHSDIDMEIIKTDMDALLNSGVDGFVFGALTASRDIDIVKCRQVVENARGKPVTFHRAFDMTIPEHKLDNVDKIAECGFTRILTSGLAESADQGIDALVEIQRYISEKDYSLLIMPGCGVTPTNAERILRETGCKEFHASAKTKVIENIPSHPSDTVAIKRTIIGSSYSVTSREIVEQLVQIGKMFQ